MTTPPEKCPICNAGMKGGIYPAVYRSYQCGAVWVEDEAPDYWFSPCKHAMTAALRVGATLEPTPLELAEKALVDAAVAWDITGNDANWNRLKFAAHDYRKVAP